MTSRRSTSAPRGARTLALAVAGGLLLGIGAVTTPATAAAAETKPSVKITKIKSKKAKYGKKVTIKPSVKKSGKVKISSKLLTVKQGSKTLAKNKKSVKLKAGTYKVTTTVKYKVGTKKTSKWVYGKTKSKKLTQTLKITQGAKPAPKKKPTSMYPSGWDCPSAYPIKGNASSMIYHMPYGSYYSRTNPEQCFATEAAAKAAGYRKSKR